MCGHSFQVAQHGREKMRAHMCVRILMLSSFMSRFGKRTHSRRARAEGKQGLGQCAAAGNRKIMVLDRRRRHAGERWARENGITIRIMMVGIVVALVVAVGVAQILNIRVLVIRIRIAERTRGRSTERDPHSKKCIRHGSWRCSLSSCAQTTAKSVHLGLATAQHVRRVQNTPELLNRRRARTNALPLGSSTSNSA